MSDDAMPGPHLRRLKSMGQLLDPVVHLGKGGLTEALLASVNLALSDHELIKVKFVVADRDTKRALIHELCQRCQCTLIQQIGHLALVYLSNPNASPGLSNLQRHAP